jgi:hypothetical protein
MPEWWVLCESLDNLWVFFQQTLRLHHFLTNLSTLPPQMNRYNSLGFLVGFLFATIMMSIVGSAVNTVIVCFAEAPAEFQANHAELSNEMRMTWRHAWPDVCGNM